MRARQSAAEPKLDQDNLFLKGYNQEYNPGKQLAEDQDPQPKRSDSV